MIESLHIENFKKFDTLKIDNLSRINLLVGINNVGKTTLLEAVFAFASGANILPLFSSSIFHRLADQDRNQISNLYPFMEVIWNVFHDKKNIRHLRFAISGMIDGEKHSVEHVFTPGSILADFLPNEMGSFGSSAFLKSNSGNSNNTGNSLVGLASQFLGEWVTVLDGKKQQTINITNQPGNGILTKDPLVLANMEDILSHRGENENRKIYSFLSRAGLLQSMIEEMNQCFPNLHITDIENIPYPDGSAAPISVRIQGEDTYPLYTLGDGVRRWFQMIGTLLVYQNAVHCIEEIDATFHHQAQEELSYQLCHYAKKYNNQLFITTHSKEYLSSFLSVLNAHGEGGKSFLRDEVRVITLRDVEGKIRTRTLNGLEAYDAVENGLELRI